MFIIICNFNVYIFVFSYTFNKTYQTDAFYPNDIVQLNEPYIVRDFRGQVVEFHPVQYNPITKILRVYTNITVEVFNDNQKGGSPIPDDLPVFDDPLLGNYLKLAGLSVLELTADTLVPLGIIAVLFNTYLKK